MNAFFRSSAIIVFICVTTICISTVANAQIVIHVDIANGSLNPPNDGRDGWGSDAFRFLQDALDAADGLFPTPQNPIQIWVAAAFDEFDEPIPYRPDQGNGYTLGNRSHSFMMRSNVRILGGFSGDGWETIESQRDWEANITVLSGDLDNDDEFCHNGDPECTAIYDPNGSLNLDFANYSDNSYNVVVADTQDETAILDGFTVRGGIELHSAQPRFRDCVIQLHDAAAVRCDDASHVMMYRCTFEKLDCDSIIVEGQSRLELVLCEPAAVLDRMVGVAQRDSHASRIRRDAWQPAGQATGCGRARVATGSELLVVDQQRWDELVDE